MASISSPTIIRVKNAANSLVVPVTRTFKFTGGLVVTQISPGEAEVNGSGILGGVWNVLGNAGGGLVLGTNTNDSFNFIQNGQSRGGYKIDGNLFINTHGGAGEVEFSTNAAVTVDNMPVSIFILNVPDLRSGRFIAKIQGRNNTGSGRAAFERSFLYYREGGGVIVSPKVQTDFTDKSNTDYDVIITTSGNDIIVQVRGAVGETINWTGYFEWQYAA